MYRKLEDGRTEDRATEASPNEAKATREAPEGECSCVCSEPARDGEEPAPAAKESTVYYPVWYDING